MIKDNLVINFSIISNTANCLVFVVYVLLRLNFSIVFYFGDNDAKICLQNDEERYESIEIYVVFTLEPIDIDEV